MSKTVAKADSAVDVDEWVDAAPFRAHLRHLMAVGDLSSSAAALLVDISPRLAFRLLYGRGGRALRRINPDTARKLLRVTAADARAVRRRTVAASSTVQHLGRLREAGWSHGDLARLLGLGPDDLAALLTQRTRSCTQLVALRASAEVSLLRTPLPLEPIGARTAA